jgi:hypothetical protein
VSERENLCRVREGDWTFSRAVKGCGQFKTWLEQCILGLARKYEYEQRDERDPGRVSVLNEEAEALNIVVINTDVIYRAGVIQP